MVAEFGPAPKRTGSIAWDGSPQLIPAPKTTAARMTNPPAKSLGRDFSSMDKSLEIIRVLTRFRRITTVPTRFACGQMDAGNLVSSETLCKMSRCGPWDRRYAKTQ